VLLLADRLREGRLRSVRALAREVPGADTAPSRFALARALAPLVLAGSMPARGALLGRAGRGPPAWLRPALARELAGGGDRPRGCPLAGPRWWVAAARDLALGIEGTGVFEMHRHRAALAGLE